MLGKGGRLQKITKVKDLSVFGVRIVVTNISVHTLAGLDMSERHVSRIKDQVG